MSKGAGLEVGDRSGQDGRDRTIYTKIALRAAKRSSLTKTLNKLNTSPPATAVDRNFVNNKLNSLKSELLNLDNEILEHYLFSNKDISSEYEQCETYMDSLEMGLSSLNTDTNLNFSAQQDNNHTLNNSVNNANLPRLKLPHVEFPKFDSKPEDYQSFIQNFEDIIDKFNLSQFDKFSYLRSQVTGPAKQIVQSIPSTDDCYDKAKGLLSDAFSNKTLQQFSVIDRMVKMKLDSSKSAYKWISEARSIIHQVERLSISVQTMIQYFMWNGLSDSFKRQFVLVTNKAKPSLDEILETSFEVFERVNDDSKLETRNKNTPKRDVANVSKVQFDYKQGCCLCYSDKEENFNDHRISSCTKYKTPESKLSKIKSLDGCTRCGFLNHKVDSCKFKFAGKCRNCNSFHAYYLCKKTQNAEPVGTCTNVVEFNVMSTNLDSDDMLIPTFTTSVKKQKNGKIDLRCMYDPASQITFISSPTLNKIKYKIINSKLDLRISGFNTSKIT